jgi:NAD+ kinase
VGRMIELGWAIGGEDLGALSCDGVICSTPSGSTGYNLSNGGPVLVWGLDAQTVTFIAAHSLHARPLVVPRGRDVEIENRTSDVPAQVLVDGRPVTQLAGGEQVVARLGEERTRLAHLPEATFFRRYRETFAS